MSSPALKDLPKVAIDLKSQLEGFSTEKLKNIDTQEKIVLPTAEGKWPSDRVDGREQVWPGNRGPVPNGSHVNCGTKLALVGSRSEVQVLWRQHMGCTTAHQRQCL